MEALQDRIVIRREALAERGYRNIDSLEDAFNDFLKRFTGRRIDDKYGDSMHQYLSDGDGDYYFDTFKYIYPTDNYQGSIAALNNNVGSNKLNIAEYSGTSIVKKAFDFSNSSVEISLNGFTEEAYKYINEAYGRPISMSYFVFLQTANQHDVMDKVASITIQHNGNKLFVMDENGNKITELPYNVKQSFYENIQSTNYYMMLTEAHRNNLEQGSQSSGRGHK